MSAVVNLVGNILADPVLRRDGPKTMFSCRVMVDRYRQGADGKPEELEGYAQSVAFVGEKAEVYFGIFKKGHRVRLQGNQIIGKPFQREDSTVTTQFDVYADYIDLVINASIQSVVRHKDLAGAGAGFAPTGSAVGEFPAQQSETPVQAAAPNSQEE